MDGDVCGAWLDRFRFRSPRGNSLLCPVKLPIATRTESGERQNAWATPKVRHERSALPTPVSVSD